MTPCYFNTDAVLTSISTVIARFVLESRSLPDVQWTMEMPYYFTKQAVNNRTRIIGRAGFIHIFLLSEKSESFPLTHSVTHSPHQRSQSNIYSSSSQGSPPTREYIRYTSWSSQKRSSINRLVNIARTRRSGRAKPPRPEHTESRDGSPFLVAR
jgi:hypothetical protein